MKGIKLRRREYGEERGALAVPHPRLAIARFPLLFHAGLFGRPYSHFSGERRSCVLAVVVGESFNCWSPVAFQHRLRKLGPRPGNESVLFLDAAALEWARG